MPKYIEAELDFEPIEMTAREKEFARLREITTEEIMAEVKIPVNHYPDKPYGHSISREMYELWWKGVFGRRGVR